MMMNKVYNCPVLDWECPYFNPEGCVCKLDDPKADCDDYYAAVGDEEDDDDDSQRVNRNS